MTTPIPAHPSLEFDRKQARKLLTQIQAGDAAAIARLCRSHPRYRNSTTVDTGQIILADTQLILAREYGFPSWPRWKAFVEISALNTAQRIEQFLRAACGGSVTHAANLLRIDASFTAHDLCAAAAAGDVTSVRRLVAAGTVNLDQGPLGTTPLVYACQSRLLVTDAARRDSIVECARLLLAAGADPNRGFMRSPGDAPETVQTAIYGAAGIANHPHLTRLLIDAGARPTDSETVYHTAEFADTTCLALILPHAGQDDIDYCLARALDFEHPDAALLFVKHGANVDRQVSWFNNQTHLMKAIAEHCDIGLIEAMIAQSRHLDRVDDQGLTAFRYAVRFGNAAAARLLRTAGASTEGVSALDRFGDACMTGQADQAASIAAAAPEVVRVIDPRLMEKAVRQDNHRALRLFVANGIPVDSNADMPPLHNACFWGHHDTAKVLVELGASLTHANEHGGTALGATITGSLMCHDRRGGPRARPPEAIAPGDYPRIVELLITAGSALPDQERGSPLNSDRRANPS
jgi:ankyrin repeat protein